MSTAFTAVILHWSEPSRTVRAARALLADGLPAERLVVVINGSTPPDDVALAAALPDVRRLRLPANLGFARGMNAGAAALPADEAYLFVNADAFLHAAGSLERLRGTLHRAGVGAAVPRLREPDLRLQPSVVPFLEPWSALVRASGLSRWVPARWAPRLTTFWDHAGDRDIQSATGAVLAVRAELWHALGGFDGRRFMYVEDHALLRRVADAGWRTRFVADAEFVHLGGASARRRWDAAARARRIAHGEARLLRETLAPGPRRLTLTALLAGAGARAIGFAARGERARAREQLGWLTGYLEGARALS